MIRKMRKVHFKTSLEAVEWLARYARDEGQFEVLREKLYFNFIYTGKYFLELDEREEEGEVILNKRK